jgi:hypothetical protein
MPTYGTATGLVINNMFKAESSRCKLLQLWVSRCFYGFGFKLLPCLPSGALEFNLLRVDSIYKEAFP